VVAVVAEPAAVGVCCHIFAVCQNAFFIIGQPQWTTAHLDNYYTLNRLIFY
jgi:hypothetical protein